MNIVMLLRFQQRIFFCCCLAAVVLWGLNGTEVRALDVDLDIPPRFQWDQRNGFCGETSVQSDLLKFGVYVSQLKVRQLAGGELLLGVNIGVALKKLFVSYENFKLPATRAQYYPSFISWSKTHLAAGNPVIFAVFLSESYDSGYDHIMPMVGFSSSSSTPSEYLTSDVIVFNNLYSNTALRRMAGGFHATRNQCNHNLDQGGCVPDPPGSQPYGTAIKGLTFSMTGLNKVQLKLARSDEPNLVLGKPAATMNAQLIIQDTTPGTNYKIYQFGNTGSIPKTLSAATLATSKPKKTYSAVGSGTGTSTTINVSFISSGLTYFFAAPV